MAKDQQTYRRAANAALTGLALQVLLALGMTLLGMWAADARMVDPGKAISAAALHLLGGIPIWIILWMVFHQHELERLESLEVEQLSRGGIESAAIFAAQEAEMRTARHRLELLYKWTVPIVSLVVAAYLMGVGLLLFFGNYHGLELGLAAGGGPSDHLVILSACLGAGFCAFIVARYLAGMTAVKEWQLLRGGASYLMGNAVVSGVLLAAGALIAYYPGSGMVYGLLTVILPGVMVALGIEMVLNFLLGAYRPRRPGEIARPAFDSRLLGWLTSPESIAKIVSETINYQFGIEVSKSWFYRLLSKALTPLLAFSVAMLVLISSVVIVEPQEMAIVTNFGVPAGDPVGPGIHFKWPWPIGEAHMEPVGRVLTMQVGSMEPGKTIDANAVILWTNTHAGKEVYLLTAPTPLAAEQAPGPAPAPAPPGTQPSGEAPTTQPDKATGASLIGAQIYIQYRVDDLARYVRCAKDPQELLRTIAERRMSSYFVTKDIDTLMLSGRLMAGAELRQQVQEDFRAAETGVTVLTVDLSGIHPPSEQDVAEAFLSQIAARQQRQTAIEQAKKKANDMLASVAGDSRQAAIIRQMISERNRIDGDLRELEAAPVRNDGAIREKQKAKDAIEGAIEAEVAKAQGEAGKIISAARAERWESSLGARAAAAVFRAQRRQYEVAPDYFLAAQYADLIASLPPDARKYIVDVDPSVKPIWEIDIKDEASPLESLLPPSR